MTLAAIATLAIAPDVNAGAFTDTFNTIDPAWVNDRYAPADFSVVADPINSGNNVLNLGISNAARPAPFDSAFYNTHGRQRAANVAANWTLSGDLLITSAMLSTTGGLMRTDLWGRDSNPTEASAEYPIFGITNASPADAFNPSAGDRSARLRYWDSTTGWVDLVTTLTTGWHNLAINYDGSSFKYLLDGNLLATDATASAPAVGELKTVFVQGYAFGGANPDYAVQWDNISAGPAAVPTPVALSAGSVLMGLVAVRRKRM